MTSTLHVYMCKVFENIWTRSVTSGRYQEPQAASNLLPKRTPLLKVRAPKGSLHVSVGTLRDLALLPYTTVAWETYVLCYAYYHQPAHMRRL